jgi:hypothetical protein
MRGRESRCAHWRGRDATKFVLRGTSIGWLPVGNPRSDIPAHHRADEPELLPITLWAPNVRRSRRRLGETAFELDRAPSCRGSSPPQSFRAGGEISSEHDVGTSKSRSRDETCRPPELAADRRNRRRGYRCRMMITRAGGSAHPREATDLGLSNRINDCGTQSARTQDFVRLRCQKTGRCRW